MSSALYYAADARLTPVALDVLRAARAIAYGEEEVDFIEAPPGVGALNMGFFPGLPEDAPRTLSPREMGLVPRAEIIVAAAMRQYQGVPLLKGPIENDAKTLYLDIETHGIEDMWSMAPEDYFRLGQYAWGIQGEVHLTESREHILELIRSAECTIAHMGHNFDWSVLFGKDSTEALELAMDRRLFCTKVFAGYNFPAPDSYVDRKGHWRKNASKPENLTHGWLSLDNLCYVFGTPGKTEDLSALAEEFGGYGKIPRSDPRYRKYAVRDVTALQGLVGAMMEFATPDDYDWREQHYTAVTAQITRNGFAVDVDAAKHRAYELQERKAELLADLEKKHDFPTEGKQPWRSKKGKESIRALLADAGIDPEKDEDWPRTKTGAISLGGEALTTALKDTPLEETGRRLAELMGQRTLAQLALECVQPDGLVHPEINNFQRSGRSSVTKPGLTVVNGAEKGYYVARPGYKLVSIDYSAADARAVVAMSGDMEYAKRFEPGVDAHELTGRASFGDELYDSNPKLYRTGSKPIGHGTNYQIGAKKLAKQIRLVSGLPMTEEKAKSLLDAFNSHYTGVTEWKKKAAQEGSRGWVTNLWGRVMPVEKGRSYTQAPGLLGQATTREIIADALMRLPIEYLLWVKVPVHDELIFEIPEDRLDEIPVIAELMRGEVNGVDFPVQAGEPADNWADATHD